MSSKMRTQFQRMLFGIFCFVVTMFILLSSSVDAADNVRCKENERRTLLELKADINEEYWRYWNIVSSWGNNSNTEECCNWRGIRCSNRTGHVISVSLPYTAWSGKFSPSWSGKFSPSLSELKHLKYLNLSYNDFSGEIPPQLGNLTNLRSLDLGHSSGLTVQNLDWVSHLNLLTHLDLSGVNLIFCNDWLNQIHKLSSLTHLLLHSCLLPDPSLPVSNTSFSAWNSLAFVDLSHNNLFSPRSYNWLFNFTTTLVYLDLSHNGFPRSEIPQAFGKIISLESLFLSSCFFEGIPYSFVNLTRLATLDLSNNELTGPLPDSFVNLTRLATLDLSNNQLTGPLPDSFVNLIRLATLDLSNNQLTGPLPNLTLFSSLETLVLNDNKLEGTIPEAYLSYLSKLSYLDLSSNSLSFNFSVDWLPPFKLDVILLKNCTLGPHFPNWIKSLRNFSKLDISHNRISDTIPHWFWDLSPRLRNLNMSNNRLEGILPNISLSFPNIDWIDMSYNLLQGPIPRLPVNLIYLDLAHNMLTGSLSLVCTSLATPSYLDLSDNKLSGELLADCFMNNYLILLNLANNDFSGYIPTSIGTYNGFESLLLRNNSFTGQMPLSLTNCTELVLLDLSENKLNGEVPTWIGTHLTGLIVLSLRMNEFSGSIPPQICHLRWAHVLDLSQNNLTGSIPHCISNFTSLVEEVDVEYGFGFSLEDESGNSGLLYPNALVQWKRVASEYKTTLQYLKLIDLSGNGLFGEIPAEFGSLKELISLNLSSNRLTGNIIPKIGQMKNLDSLDLSRNHLSGEIPSGLASLTFLSVLDLSNNNLTGKIPSSTQLQSFNASDFAGNEHLCGPPLSNKCGVVISLSTGHDDKGENNEEDDAKFPKLWLYVSVVLGFGTGLWGFIGPLVLRRTWRHAFYKWLGNITDWICVTTILHMTRLQRKFYG